MARTKIVLFKSNIRRDGSCPVCLRVAKEDKTKYIDLQLSATKGQWDELASRFKKDKRVNPNYENYNALLNIQGWGETKRKINLGGAVFITTTCVKAVSPKIYIIDKNTNEIYFEL